MLGIVDGCLVLPRESQESPQLTTCMPKRKPGYSALNVDVPEHLAKRIRSLAEQDGRKLNWLVAELIRLGLDQYSSRTRSFAGGLDREKTEGTDPGPTSIARQRDG